MTNDELDMDAIAEEDVVDAINDPESTDALELLELYYRQKIDDSKDADVLIANAKTCATMLFDAKRYEDVVEWLDTIATKLSDNEGPDSELYMQFAESDVLEELRMKATDKIFGDEEGEEENDDFDDDDN
jgi:hypothetical protein